MKLLIQPHDGVEPLLAAIKKAKQSIDILIFRMDLKELEVALKEASAKGLSVRALIAYTNRGGEAKLRNLETRFLEAGIVVGRTSNDLIRYHGKMMIVDRKTLFLLSFNFVHLDIEHSRGFGVVTSNPKTVLEATKLFEADLNRQTYTGAETSLIVSPTNSRTQLADFLRGAKSQLLIYDPKISDKQMLKILDEQRKAGVDVKIIGSVDAKNLQIPVTALTTMRLHTRTIIRDGRQAFVGSQSLRQPELDLRREIGIMIRDREAVNSLTATFEKDWAATGYEEVQAAAKPAASEVIQDPDAAKALAKELPPLAENLKKAIKKAVGRAGKAAQENGDALKATVKDVVKQAVKDAVNELVLESQEA